MASLEGGRDLPGRLSLAGDGAVAGIATSALLAVLVLVTRVPLQTRYLLNWDAAQFALGLVRFDIVHHQPHPPGYLGFELLGRLLLPLTGDANQALTWLSIGGEVAGVLLAYWFARALFGRVAGWVAALALTVSPLFWYYGEAGDTYGLEPALALAIGWPAWAAWNGERRAALPAAAALALAGFIRPSTAFLLLPLTAVSVLRLRDLRLAAGSAAVAAALTAAWGLPLVLAAGGPSAYLTASVELGGSVTASTAIWRAGLAGLLTTSSAVLLGTAWELGGFALIAVFGLAIAPRLERRARGLLPAGWPAFGALWAAPALLTFLFIHIGQVVYIQVFAVAIVLSLGPALEATCLALNRPRLRSGLLGAALIASLATFFLPPRISLAGQLRAHDRHVALLNAAVAGYDPATTALVVDAYASGSYREAQVYLPAYHRVAVARDEHGRPGEIFGDLYEPERFVRAIEPSFAEGTTTYLFLDEADVWGLLGDPDRLSVRRLADGSRIYVWHGAAPRVEGRLMWLGPAYNLERGALP